MFNVGGGEVFVILLVALIVLGPDKLPGAVRKVGQVIAELRKVSSGFQTEMRSAMFEAETSQRTTTPTVTPAHEAGAVGGSPGDSAAEGAADGAFDPPLPPEVPRSPLDMDRPE